MNTFPCPFCGLDDFDLIGLKSHLAKGECEVFEETEVVTNPFDGIAHALTPAQVLAKLRERLRKMDCYRLWDVSYHEAQDAGPDSDGPEIRGYYEIGCEPPYSNAKPSEKSEGWQVFRDHNLEDCFCLAEQYFGFDLDAQIKVLTKGRMECAEDLAVLREILKRIGQGASPKECDLYDRILEIIEHIENNPEAAARDAAWSKKEQEAQDKL